MSGRRTALWVAAALALVLAVTAAVLYSRLQDAERRSGDAARAEVARVAGEGAAALLTYAPDTVSADMYAAAERLTGDYRDHYGWLTDTVVVPTARDRGISTSAEVTGTGLSELGGDTAEALVFLTRVTTSAAEPDPVTTTVSARVELRRVDGTWLISGFEVS